MLAQEFMRNALVAGSAVGIACGLVGWFVVLRAQVFAGDTLGHVAFTGALAAAVLGVDLRAGLFVATILAGLAVGALGDRAGRDDVAVGTFLAWTLGVGALCLSIFARTASGSDGTAGVRVLFGSIFGLSAGDVLTSSLIAALAVLVLAAVARPLLYASVDSAVAAAQGVPVRALGLVFLALVGLVAAQATQAIGALLLLGLLAAPAGAAHRLTARPALGPPLSAALALASVWLGLALAYRVPSLPPSTAIVAVAVAIFAGAMTFPALLRLNRVRL